MIELNGLCNIYNLILNNDLKDILLQTALHIYK